MFRFSLGENLFVIFLTALCILISVVFVGYFCKLKNCLRLSMFVHFYMYFPLTMITIPLAFSWRTSNIMCGYIDNLFITSQSLYGTLIALYFLYALLSFVLRYGNLVCVMLVSLSLILWQWALNLIQTRL